MSDRAALRLIAVVSLGVVALVGYLLLGHRPDAGLAPGVAALPLLNACLNATSAALLTDRKSTRLNSSHSQISYAVFCLKKKKKTKYIYALVVEQLIKK